ncbi:hypothetical protein MHB50_16610 [Siminovitchia sp. FSL H7-0308]|nr:hypothetical protein [Siminovitchia thermophila]
MIRQRVSDCFFTIIERFDNLATFIGLMRKTDIQLWVDEKAGHPTLG